MRVIEMPQPQPISPVTQVVLDPAMEKRNRRQFSTVYKLSILAQADACKNGELNALLRCEKLYSNQLSDWRKEFAQNGVKGLRESVLV
jgi:transposase